MKNSLTLKTLIYGAVFALLLLLLKTIEYRFFIRSFSKDIYLGAIALVFTILGFWAASNFLTILNPPPTKLENFTTAEGSLFLSERELEVIKKMADGLSNQQIADSLYISIHTVKTHTANIFEKLHVQRRTQAVLRAKEMGILDERVTVS